MPHMNSKIKVLTDRFFLSPIDSFCFMIFNFDLDSLSFQIEWPDDTTIRISLHNSSFTQTLHPPSNSLKDLIIFENTPFVPPDLSQCENCDVCLGSDMLCACQFGEMDNGSCKSSRFLFIVIIDRKNFLCWIQYQQRSRSNPS